MQANFLSEAYKPQERVAFSYLVIRAILSRICREQKFPTEIESMLFKIYDMFQKNANALIKLYRQETNVLDLGRLLEDIGDEVDSVFQNSGMVEPLMDEEEAVPALIKFLEDIEVSYLDPIVEMRNSIKNFEWNIASFKDALQQIEKKGLEYVNTTDEHVGSGHEEI